MVKLDAESRGLKNPKFWGIFAAGGKNGGGLILKLVYFIITFYFYYRTQ